MGFRGLFSSLGAGVSLVIAGVLTLLVMSSVVAFRGWPGVGGAPETGSADILRVADNRTRTTSERDSAAPSVKLARATASSRENAGGAAAGDAPGVRTGGTLTSRSTGTGRPARPRSTATPAPTATPPAQRRSTAEELEDTVTSLTEPLQPGSQRRLPRVRLPKVNELPAADPVIDELNSTLQKTTDAVEALLP